LWVRNGRNFRFFFSRCCKSVNFIYFVPAFHQAVVMIDAKILYRFEMSGAKSEQ
jgi:hypothetical protein